MERHGRHDSRRISADRTAGQQTSLHGRRPGRIRIGCLFSCHAVRRLQDSGYENILIRRHDELELTDQNCTFQYLKQVQPDVVILAAAKVGGIQANSSLPADFIEQNLAIQANVITGAFKTGVRKVLFLGSSCIYPRDCPQPIKESELLSGPLEWANRPYAIAKIAGFLPCQPLVSLVCK